jgi:ribosome-binding protein aMBF1 (putative translation factor)
MSVLRRVPKMRQTVAFMAPPSTRSCYPWRISTARRQSVLSLSAYATKIGRSLVPADVERDLIRTRTAEGRSRAKARGKHMGRPPSSKTPEQQKEATRRRSQGATLQELADSYHRSISTMRRNTRAA